MKLTFFSGAGGNVIPSRILLGSTLLDCGDAVPEKKDPNYKAKFGQLIPKLVKTVLLSHAHTDHVDALCDFVKAGFHEKIESTGCTKEISKALIEHNHVHNNDYSLVNSLFKLWQRPRNFLERFEISDGIYATFYPAGGHILGASSILLEFEKEKLRVLYSGDLGNTNKHMLEVNGEVPEADIVIMESTYGRREHHPNFELSLKDLYEEINKTYEKGGNPHIPALSINKLQEALYHSNQGIEEGNIPEDINIVVDSYLGEEITEIYAREHNRKYFSDTAKNYFNNYSTTAPFHYTNQVTEGGKNIIIASSGLDGLRGQFKKYFKDLSNENNSVIVISHTLEGSPLYDIATGKERIGTNGKSIHLNARRLNLTGFASHADATQLIEWFEKTRAKYVFLVHGENDSRLNLKEMIASKGLCPAERIILPALGEEFNPMNLPKARNSCSVPSEISTIPPTDNSAPKTMVIGGHEFPVKYQPPAKKKSMPK